MNDLPLLAVVIGGRSLQAVMAEDMRCYVLHEDQRFDALPTLLDAVPQLATPEHLTDYCRLANLLLTGRQFELIEDPTAFRTRYELRLSQPLQDPPAPWQEYGPFELLRLGKPEVEGNNVRFFVNDRYNGVPYQVRLAFPVSGPSSEVHYELLPYR